MKFSLNVINVCSDLSDVCDISDSLICVVSTPCFLAGSSRSVFIVTIQHDTLLFLEGPGGVHPATSAAPKPVVFIKETAVMGIVSEGTVN